MNHIPSSPRRRSPRRSSGILALLWASSLHFTSTDVAAKALLGEPEVDRASDQYDGLWCPAEQIQFYDGSFTADGPHATFVFIASNHPLNGGWRRERIDNVTVCSAADYALYKHLPDSLFAAAVNCIEVQKNYFHFSDVPPANMVFLEKFPAGASPGWDMTDGAYSIVDASAPNAYALPLDTTGGSLGLGADDDPSVESTTEVTISGLTAGVDYVVSTWTGCIDAAVGHDMLIQVYGTEFFSLAAWQPIDVGPGRGVAWGDFDSDLDPDLFVTNSNSPCKFWRNDGGTFADRTTAAGLSLNTLATGVSWADYDEDGDLDLHVGSGGQDRLFRNNGNGTFANVTAGSIGDTRQAECLDWGDYDKDGDVDVFVGNIEDDGLFRNDGGGAFKDVATGTLLGSGRPVGCSWVDFDDDGDLDLFVTYSNLPNELFVNTSGTFVKSTPSVLASPQNGTSAAWADYDNDGDLDVYLTAQGSNNRLCRNNGGGSFAEVTPRNLDAPGNNVESVWGDSDNDGLLDLYLVRSSGANVLFRNQGNGDFAARPTGTVENAGNGAGAAWGDADKDGDSDLYLVNVNAATGGIPDAYYTNEFGDEFKWLKVDLKGVQSNSFGVGAKVFVTAGGKTQMREVGGESGLRSQNSLTADFGVGNAAIAATIRVEWPSGLAQTLQNVPTNQRILIWEGVGATDASLAEAVDVPSFELRAAVPNPSRGSTSISYSLPHPGDIELRVFDVSGRIVKTLDAGGKNAGEHRVDWNGHDEAGRPAAPGIYFYELRSGDEAVTRKMVRVD